MMALGSRMFPCCIALLLYCQHPCVLGFAVSDPHGTPAPSPVLSPFTILGTKFRHNPNLVSSQCTEDILYMMDEFGENHTSYSPTPYWQRHMLDSFGKISSGQLEGNAFLLGDLKQCTSVSVWKNINQPTARDLDFRGKYCLTSLNHYYPTTDVQLPLVGTTSVCIPSSCNASEVEAILNDYFFPIKTKITENECKSEAPIQPDWITIACLATFGILGGLVLLGTLTDITPRIINAFTGTEESSNEDKKPRGTMTTVLVAFSAYTNTQRLFNTKQTGTPHPLACINGIRAISMTFVAACHMAVISLFLSTGKHNVTMALVLMRQASNQIFYYGSYTVDTFFCMTGFLVTYLVLDMAAKTGRFNIVVFYLHRMWRLTPTLVLAYVFASGPYQLTGTGPLWTNSVFYNVTTCRASLWRAPLYINVYFDIFNPVACLPHSWYLDIEMLYYVLSVFILYPTIKKHWSGTFLWNVAFISTLAIIWHISITEKTENIFSTKVISIRVLKYFRHIYLKPWGKAPCYLIGMLYGYVYHAHGKDFRLSKKAVAIGWLASGFVFLSCIYGNYRYTFEDAEKPSRAIYNVYGSFSSPGWAAAVGWTIIACATGYGGVVNSILSWRLYVPMGRLAYCSYIVHIIVIAHFSSGIKRAQYLDYSFVIYSQFTMVFLTMCAAYILSMMIEGPTLQLEQLIFRKPGGKTENKRNRPDKKGPQSVDVRQAGTNNCLS